MKKLRNMFKVIQKANFLRIFIMKQKKIIKTMKRIKLSFKFKTGKINLSLLTNYQQMNKKQNAIHVKSPGLGIKIYQWKHLV